MSQNEKSGLRDYDPLVIEDSEAREKWDCESILS